jgi:selenocysteine lyase/cysteine desulfurase
MPADDDQKRVREIFASLIEAEDASDIAIMPSTAFAISLAARNIQKCLPKSTGF